jgi:hypothetical protein
LRALLERTGAINHVEVVRLLSDLGTFMGEDGHIQGSGAPSGFKSIKEMTTEEQAARLYRATPSR